MVTIHLIEAPTKKAAIVQALYSRGGRLVSAKTLTRRVYEVVTTTDPEPR